MIEKVAEMFANAVELIFQSIAVSLTSHSFDI